MKNRDFHETDRFAQAQALILDYWELMKPRLVFLVLFSTMIGYFLAAGNFSPAPVFWAMMGGTSLVAAASMVLNQWMERDVDALMTRTHRRPIPSGRVDPAEALGFGLVLAVLGIGILEMSVNSLASLIAALTLLSYLFLYTPLKRQTAWCTLVGALPGALPPLIGWAAARGTIWDSGAAVIFMILFLWQMPHFYAIAWIFRQDYARAGLQVLSVSDPEGGQLAKQSVTYALVLLPVSLLPTLIGLTGVFYFSGALLLGILLVAVSAGCVRSMERGARILFRASIIYLSLLFILMLVDKA